MSVIMYTGSINNKGGYMTRKHKPRKDQIVITMDISEWEKLQSVLWYAHGNKPLNDLDKKFATELFQLPLV